MLHEVLDDDFEVEIVPVYEGKQYEAEYLTKNPNHCVPTLQVTMPDGRSMHMIESAAMVTFLADAFPEKGLAPAPSPLGHVHPCCWCERSTCHRPARGWREVRVFVGRDEGRVE